MAPSRALARRAATLIYQHLPQPQTQSARLFARYRIHNNPLNRTTTPLHKPLTSTRLYSTHESTTTTPSSGPPTPPSHLSPGELAVFEKIAAELEPVSLEVQDISGGCGSMYALEIASPKFQGLSTIKQHKLVNKVLKEEIAGWHGVQLRTKAV
jgi:stress-induced morphogen